MPKVEIQIDQNIASNLGADKLWLARYLRGIFLAYLLEPTVERRRKRILVASAADLLRRIDSDKVDQSVSLNAKVLLADYCRNESSSIRRSGSIIHYRKKLEPRPRQTAQANNDANLKVDITSNKVKTGPKSHLREVVTVGIMVDLFLVRSAVGNRGRSSMETARGKIIDGTISSSLPVYRNELDIKRAWKSKGSVAQLCAAFVKLLERADSTQLSSELYSQWSEEMEDFLGSAFMFQDFLVEPSNFAPQSLVPRSVQQLPEFVRV